MTRNKYSLREDDPRSSSPRHVRTTSAPTVLIVGLLIGVAVWLLTRKGNRQQPTPPSRPAHVRLPSEEDERAERQRDLERVRDDYRRNQPPPLDGIARYQETVQ